MPGFNLRLTPRLWAFAVIAAIALALGVAKAAMAFDDLTQYLVYRTAFTLSCFLAMFPMARISAWLWRRHWTGVRTALVGAAAAYALGILCSICAVLSHGAFGREPWGRTFAWENAFNGSYLAFLLLGASSALYFGIKQYQLLMSERDRLFAANALAREAELLALRYQLQPHFLFNTLNAISTLVREGDSRAATRMIAQLAKLLRATLEGTGTHEVTLEQEIALTQHYLAIEQVRFGARLTINVDVARGTEFARVPNLILQPLVENAIKHGIAPRTQGGSINILAYRKMDNICLVVSDDGDGIKTSTHGRSPRVGIGLANTRARLDRLYPERYRFNVSYPAAGGCRVELDLPHEGSADDLHLSVEEVRA